MCSDSCLQKAAQSLRAAIALRERIHDLNSLGLTLQGQAYARAPTVALWHCGTRILALSKYRYDCAALGEFAPAVNAYSRALVLASEGHTAASIAINKGRHLHRLYRTESIQSSAHGAKGQCPLRTVPPPCIRRAPNGYQGYISTV